MSNIDVSQLVTAEEKMRASVPASIASSDGKAQLLRMGLMTPDEVVADAVPAFLVPIFDALDPTDRAMAYLDWRRARWERGHPLFVTALPAAAAAAGQAFTPDDINQFFRDAAGA